jgi:tetratricopeptide (TPR) repeat protein
MAVSRMASIADSNFWMESQFRRDHYGEILDRSVLALNPCTKGDLLAGSRTESLQLTTLDLGSLKEECALFVLGNPDDLSARVDLAEILMALGEYDTAREHLDFAVAREPDLGRARTALGRWYAAQGDIGRARDEWIRAAQLEEAEALVLLGDSYPPAEVPEDIVKRLQQLAPLAAGGARDYRIGFVYYRMKFARESSPTILMPGDWQNALPGEYETIEEALSRWPAVE